MNLSEWQQSSSPFGPRRATWRAWPGFCYRCSLTTFWPFFDNFHIDTMFSGFFWLTYKALHHLVFWELCRPCPGHCHLRALLLSTLWGQNLASSSNNQFRHSIQVTGPFPPILCFSPAPTNHHGIEQLQ